MDVLLIVALFFVGIIVGWYDRYSVQRTYADLYADRHGGIPPLIGWAFESDPDAEVDYWRRIHRNLYALVSALGLIAILIIVVRGPTWV